MKVFDLSGNPMKIELKNDGNPMKVLDVTDEELVAAKALVGEQERMLADENARLAYENAILRMYAGPAVTALGPDWFAPCAVPHPETQAPPPGSCFFPVGYMNARRPDASKNGVQSNSDIARMDIANSFPAAMKPPFKLASERLDIPIHDESTREQTSSEVPSAGCPFAKGKHAWSGPLSKVEPAPPSEWTTVMLRNIPCELTRDSLVDFIIREGFSCSFDLIYLPVDFKTEIPLGYAFVNLDCRETAERFLKTFDGYSDWGMGSPKVCKASWSDVLQGVEANVERYRNSPVMHEDVADHCQPALFHNDARVPFPAPTRRIRKPRRRHVAPDDSAAPEGGETGDVGDA